MMTLSRGKFYKDGRPVPIEFGNMEQIKLLKKAEALVDGVFVWQSFTCLCGWKFDNMVNECKEAIRCPQCSLRYNLEKDNDMDELTTVTLKK